MTKRMIDADALLEQIQIEKNNCPFGDLNSKRGWEVALLNIEQHISLLTTPAYETQGSIFDAHAFNLKEESRHSQYWRPNDILISNQDTIIKLSADNFNCHKLRKLRNITAEQRCLYSKICELADKLDEKIQQERIFDAEGWCWDLSLAPKNTVVVYFFPDKSPPKGFPPIGKVESIYSNSIVSKNTNAKAWRPIPNIPKEA